MRSVALKLGSKPRWVATRFDREIFHQDDMPPTGKAALDFVSRFSLLFCAGRFRPKLYRIVTLVESGQAQQEIRAEAV